MFIGVDVRRLFVSWKLNIWIVSIVRSASLSLSVYSLNRKQYQIYRRNVVAILNRIRNAELCIYEMSDSIGLFYCFDGWKRVSVCVRSCVCAFWYVRKRETEWIVSARLFVTVFKLSKYGGENVRFCFCVFFFSFSSFQCTLWSNTRFYCVPCSFSIVCNGF